MVSSDTLQGDNLEPTLSFAHAQAKVYWAEKHIDYVNRFVANFIETEQKAGILRFHPQSGTVYIGGQIVPGNVALAAGDAIFNLRSALDCCWMGMKRAIDAKAGKATLPRAKTRKEVIGVLKNASMEHAFPRSDEIILDEIRPYEDGSETLWFAGQLDNWNKHNMLISHAQSTRTNSITIRHKNGGDMTFTDCNFVGQNTFNLGPGNVKDFTLEGDTNLSIDVVLVCRRTSEERPVVPFLSALLKETHAAVELLVREYGAKT